MQMTVPHMSEIYSTRQIDTYNKATSRINIFEGSVRAGKSHIALEIFIKELKYGPVGEYLICGKSEHTVVRNVIVPLNKICDGIIRYKRGIGEFHLFGHKIYVVGANDERSSGKIQGLTLAGALVDEASIIPESFWKMLLSRLSVPNAKLFATTNPDSPYHWLKTDYIDNDKILDKQVFRFKITDNPVLTEKYITSLKQEYSGLWYKRYIDGDWVLAEGSIYDFFDESIHTIREPHTYGKYFILGIDYGTTNPFAAVLVGFNDDSHPILWVEKEYYWDSKKMGRQKTDMEYCQDVIREFGGYPIKLMYLDPSAASFEEELKRNRLPVRQAKNDVLDGIRFVSDLFIRGDLVVCKQCVNLIQEIQSYVWDSKSIKLGVDKPLKQRDHANDALRYAVFTHWGLKRNLSENRPETNINPMSFDGWGPNSYGWQRC